MQPWVQGTGFDTCAAPSIRTMAAWRRAYRVTNIYIGGVARSCGQRNLTRRWVRAVHRMGYRLIPTYVGLQAPCTRFRKRFTVRNAAQQGVRSANDAVRRAKALGIGPQQPIYYDMEPYNSGDSRCRRAVLRFMDRWTRTLAARGYVSGVYSVLGSAIRDLSRAKGIAKPTAVWFAHWDGKAGVRGRRYLHRWKPHLRIKQYRGDHRERHGGVSLLIDTDAVDGRVF